MAEPNTPTSGATRTTTSDSPTARQRADSSHSPDDQHQPRMVDRVKQSATAQLTNQKDRGTDALGSVAQAVRSSTQRLRDEHHDALAGYVDKAADQIEGWSRRLKEKDIDELVTDVQRLARRQPAVFIGSAFVLGIAGARFLKSSRQQNEYGYGSESRRGMYGGQPQMSTAHDRVAWNRGDANTTIAIEEVSISEIEPDTTAAGRSGQRSLRPGIRTEKS